MSINANVTVYLDHDGGGSLALSGEERGQGRLYFRTAPEEVTALNGRHIWGGASTIMLGDREIAKRVGYTGIEFVSREDFIAAIAENNECADQDPQPGFRNQDAEGDYPE